MALNLDFVGRVFPPSPVYEVGREKLREFATAIGDRNPAFHDVEAARALGYADVIAAPTFAVVLSMRSVSAVWHDPDLGLDYARVVHGEQRFAYTRPIVAGDRLIVTTSIESLRTMAGNDLVTTRGEISTESGEPVATAFTMVVSRGPEEASE